MSESIKLNREQLQKLTEIVERFPEVKNFTIEADSSSGIGVGVSVRFNLFDAYNFNIDITDVREW